MKPCDCQDWLANIEKINGPIVLQSIRAGRNLYDGRPFGYCPWCGSCLLEQHECKHDGLRRFSDMSYQCEDCHKLITLRLPEGKSDRP